MDPMAGAGTVGMEAIVRGMMKRTNSSTGRAELLPLAVLTGDIDFEDARVQRKNFDKDLIFEAAQNFKWIPIKNNNKTEEQKELEQQDDVVAETTTTSSASIHHPLLLTTSTPCTTPPEILEFREKLLRFGLQRCAGGCGINWDATRLPLRSGVIDVIVSDLPFGQRCGNKRQNMKLYPALLKEFHRVLTPKNGRAILLTLERGLMKNVLEKLTVCNSNAVVDNNNSGNTNTKQNDQKKRPADPRLKEDVLKQEKEGKLFEQQNQQQEEEEQSSSSSSRPMFIQPRPEFCIDMGGLYPFCFVLEKN